MELLEHLGEDGWPKTVLFRVPSMMCMFELKDDAVVVKLMTGLLLGQITTFCNTHYSFVLGEKPTAVLLLELSEKEDDPDINMPFCYICAKIVQKYELPCKIVLHK